MTSEDGVTLRDLVRMQLYDVSYLFGPAPLLLIKAPDLASEAPYMIDTPPDRELAACSTAELILGEDTVSRYVAPGAVVVPVRKSRRNPFADAIIVGRSANCDLRLHDNSVSKVHCYLLPPPGWPAVNGRWKIQDQGSTNGTTLLLGSGPAKLSSGKPMTLAPDQELRFGGVEAIFLEGARLAPLVDHAQELWRRAEDTTRKVAEAMGGPGPERKPDETERLSTLPSDTHLPSDAQDTHFGE